MEIPWLYAAANYLITVRLLLLFSTEVPKAMFCHVLQTTYDSEAQRRTLLLYVRDCLLVIGTGE